jgi:Right handed beta helix region
MPVDVFNVADSWAAPQVALTAANLATGADGFGTPVLTTSSSGPPVVSPASFAATLPVTQNQNIGTPVSATNSPTSWAITAGDIWGNFGITSGGQIFVNYVDIPPQTYSLTVQATNSYGSGTATVTLAVSVHGTVYHIATTGNDSNVGSQASPWLTFAKAASVVNPGDGVLVHAGTYGPLASLTFSRGGNSTYPVIFAPYGTDSVTITANTGGSGFFLECYGISYLILMGFTINGSNSTTAVASGSLTGVGILSCGNIYLSNCTVEAFSNTGIMVQNGSGNHNIMFNTVHDNCLNDYANAFGNSGGWGAGMGIYDPSTMVYGCTVYHNWGEGIDSINANGVTTAGCLVWDNMSTGVYITQSENCMVYGNFIYYTGSATWKRSSGAIAPGLQTDNEATGGAVKPLQNNYFFNNIVVGNETGFTYYDYQPVGMQNCIIANNAFVNILYQNLNIDPDTNTSGCVFENNIFYGGASPPTGSASGCTFRNNCWYNQTRSGGFIGSGDITSNPNFVGPVGGLSAADYKLSSGSPCFGAGYNASSVFTTDFGGNPRPASGAWTIGAWQ